MKRQIKDLLYLTGIIGTFIFVEKETKDRLNKIQQLADKNQELFFLMNQWVRIKQDGKNISDYFLEREYKRIAVYGMGHAGKTLIRELRGTEVEISYVIDKNADKIYTDIKKVSDINSMPDVDAVVVTVIASYNEIKEELQKKILSPIISLNNVLDDM